MPTKNPLLNHDTAYSHKRTTYTLYPAKREEGHTQDIAGATGAPPRNTFALSPSRRPLGDQVGHDADRDLSAVRPCSKNQKKNGTGDVDEGKPDVRKHA